MAITDYKVSEIYAGRDIASLPDRPNEAGMSASALKVRFDQLGKEVIPNYNDLIDFIELNLFSGGTQSGHTHNVDNLEDGTTNRLYTDVEKTKLAGIAEGAEVNQNSFSNVKVGATTIASTTKTDTIELVAGLNIAMTLDTVNKKITLNATGDVSTEAIQSMLVDLGDYYTALNVEDALQEVGAKLSPSNSKVTPIDTDTILLSDSADSSIFKKLTWENIKATLKAYFDTLYAVVNHVHSIYATKPTNEATAIENQILKANGDGTSTYVDFSGGGQLLGTTPVKAIAYNAQTIAENITIPSNYNCMSVGAITIQDGYTVTLEEGAVWVII